MNMNIGNIVNIGDMNSEVEKVKSIEKCPGINTTLLLLLLSIITNIILLLWKGKMFVFKTITFILKFPIVMFALYSVLLNVLVIGFKSKDISFETKESVLFR